MPAAFVKFAAGWRRLHPDWEYRLWGEDDVASLSLHNRDLYDRAEELCPNFSGQLKSDILRYELLYQFGGVWVDTDFECLKPIDELLDGVRCFAAWEIEQRVVNNAILGCEPGDRFMDFLVMGLIASVVPSRGQRPSKISGPHYLTTCYENRACAGQLTVLPQEFFYPYACNELDRAGEDFPESYAVHHWANQRRLRRKPL